MTYRRLPVSTDLCAVALEEALHQGLPVEGNAILYVHPNKRAYATELTSLLPKYSSLQFPKITVTADERLQAHEWFIECQGVAIGSPSV